MSTLQELKDKWGLGVSNAWGLELNEAGLIPNVAEAAVALGFPARTLVSRLRRGDRGQRLHRPLQRRPHHRQKNERKAPKRRGK